MKINAKRIISLLLALAMVLALAACGGKKEIPADPAGSASASVSEEASAQGTLPELLVDGETMEVNPGDYLTQATYNADEDGNASVYLNDEEQVGSEMTIGGIGIGADMEQVLAILEPGKALLDYEYDPYGDGCTEIDTEVFQGEMIDLEELKVLDCNIRVIYVQDDSGAWQPMEVPEGDFPEIPDCIVVWYDIEGPNGDYGAGVGKVCALTWSK